MDLSSTLSQPFRPFEQLLSVLPAASKVCLSSSSPLLLLLLLRRSSRPATTG